MSAPRPAPPEGCASWLDYVLDPCQVPVAGEVAHARAELAELRGHLKQQQDNVLALMQERDSLRAQVAELRGAVLDLGELVGVWDDARMDYVEVQVDKPVLSAWNALVARLRAEAPAQGKEEQ